MARRPISLWSGPRFERAATWLVLAGTLALPLQNTATVDIGFTVRLSHLLFAAALVVGLPHAVRGFFLLPPWLRWSAVGLVATYVAVTATSDLATVAGTPRGGALRAVVYLGDLVLGVGLMCLVPGLWRGLRSLRALLVAFTCGAALAALYALWQWPAQRFGLPLSDIVTTRDSTGITSGGEQGPGLLGWERVRSSFLEPHFLGAFMAAAVGIALLLAAQLSGRARLLALSTCAPMVLALVLTSSTPAYAMLVIATVVAGTAWAVGAGRPRLAALAAAGAAAVVLAAPTMVAAPEILGALSGRDDAVLTATAEFRKQTWSRVLDLWAAQPAGGYGAGQSSVRLSIDIQGESAVGLNSAQGLWAASLLDAGLVGFGFWIALLGAALLLGLLLAWSSPSLATAALALAVTAGVCSALVATDRLDLRVWLLLGLVAAAGAFAPAPGERPGKEARRGDEQAGASSDRSPA